MTGRMGICDKGAHGSDRAGDQRQISRMRHGSFMMSCGLVGWGSVLIRHIDSAVSYQRVL
jgi:hypothetical protein